MRKMPCEKAGKVASAAEMGEGGRDGGWTRNEPGGNQQQDRTSQSAKTDTLETPRHTHTLTPAHLDTVSPYTVPTPLLRGRCVAAPAKCDRDTSTTNTADAVTSIRSGRPLAVMDFRSHPAPNTLATSLKPPRGTAAVHTDPATPPESTSPVQRRLFHASDSLPPLAHPLLASCPLFPTRHAANQRGQLRKARLHSKAGAGKDSFLKF
ncbi:hypothetical protein EDB80DRAFT_814019 [Ilyonectria destructans]|nr:hypothetical protein EDB80DRAFT_814019 [Ilyonectria destructans]